MKYLFIFLIFVLFEKNPLFSQIYFSNPSFNSTDTVLGVTPPLDWRWCRFSPDIIPNSVHRDGRALTQPPTDGITCIGLGSINNPPNLPNFTEAIGQRLGSQLLANQDYYFLVDMMREWIDSTGFIGGRRPLGLIKLRVHLGNGANCDSSQTIYTSSIADTFWRREVVQFRPSADGDFITFAGTGFNQVGSRYWDYLYIDNLSPIYEGVYTGITSPTLTQTPGPKGELHGIRVYPNPTSGVVQLYVPDGVQLSEVRVYDSVGRLVLRKNDNNWTNMDVSAFPNGIYLLEFWNEQGKLGCEKLVKQ